MKSSLSLRRPCCILLGLSLPTLAGAYNPPTHAMITQHALNASVLATGSPIYARFFLRGIKCLRGLPASLLVSALAACSSPLTQPLTGIVVDASTGQGLGDVVVLATWSGNVGLVDRARHCAHAETTVTDAQGRFSLAGAPTGPDADTEYKDRFVEAYKEGYRTGIPADGNADEKTTAIRLQAEHVPDTDRSAHVVGHLWSVLGQSCGEEDGSSKNLYRLHIREVAELRRLAHTEAEEHQWRYFEAYLKWELVNPKRPTRLQEVPNFGDMLLNVNPNDAFRAEDVLK